MRECTKFLLVFGELLEWSGDPQHENKSTHSPERSAQRWAGHLQSGRWFCCECRSPPAQSQSRPQAPPVSGKNKQTNKNIHSFNVSRAKNLFLCIQSFSIFWDTFVFQKWHTSNLVKFRDWLPAVGQWWDTRVTLQGDGRWRWPWPAVEGALLCVTCAYRLIVRHRGFTMAVH